MLCVCPVSAALLGRSNSRAAPATAKTEVNAAVREAHLSRKRPICSNAFWRVSQRTTNADPSITDNKISGRFVVSVSIVTAPFILVYIVYLFKT
jgi:hypothetical protein